MTTETTPTLNTAQRDGIRALRFVAYDIERAMDAERSKDLDPADLIVLARDSLCFSGVPLHETESRAQLDHLIAWADRKLKIGGSITLNHAPALRRLLDDATALLRWVDGAL